MATQVGQAVISLTFDGKDVKASLSKVENEIKKSGSQTGGSWANKWSIAAGNLIAKGVSKIANTVSNTMGKAISRMDTLSNFPKVMTALGYSSEEASASVNTISDALDGLPTSLDAMVGDVQKLAATLGNLSEGEVNATSVGLALNDMLLAGGKGTEAASAAMEQYNQMLSQGTVDMQSWRSMVNAAPGQMDQLAKSLLGATANQADLYAALQEGTLSFEDMNAAIVRLDKEGGEGFSSFYDQAVAATGGVATQLENIGNTMNKIVAAALAGNLEDISKYTDQLMQRIGAVAPTLIRGFTGAFAALAKALPGIIIELLPAIMEGLMTLLNALVGAIPTVIPQIIDGVTNGIVLLAQTITQPQFLSLLLQAALTLFTELVKAIPRVLVQLVNALPQIVENIVAFLLDPNNLAMIIDAAAQLFFGLILAVPQILGALIGAFGTLVGDLWNWITERFGQFAADFGNFIGGIFKGAINGVLTFIENFINAPIDLLNGFIGIINEAFGFLGVDLGYIDRIQLPRLAQGGVVDSATAAVIGEEGQEAVLPLENNTGNWAGLLAATLATEMQEQDTDYGRPIVVNATFQINSKLDAEEVGGTIIQSIRRAGR